MNSAYDALEGSGSSNNSSVDPVHDSDESRHQSTGNGGKVDNAMEWLSGELQQDIAPRKLLRQFSLNILPYSGTGSSGELGTNGSSSGSSGGSSGGSRRPSVVGDSPHPFGRHNLQWRSRGLTDSFVEQDGESESPAASAILPLGFHPLALVGGSLDANDALAPRSHDTFEAKFGDGFLGLEFVINDARRQVMVKSVQAGSWSKNILHIPLGAAITRGLIVDSLNGRDVATLEPEDVLDMLQYTQRPLTVRFRRCEASLVACKLCECKIDAWSLDEHTNYCVMSRRFELEADQINNALTRLATSIQANLASDTMRTLFLPEVLHFYNALRVIAVQASACDGSQVESFALCSRLIKILDRVRQQEPTDTSNFAVERGIKYCQHVRNLIHAKMSKMRQTHKVFLQQAPNDGRAPFQRTKSLEEMENAVTAPLSSVRRPSACRVTIRDFRIVKPISKGAFGKVYLAMKKTTGDQYAIKVLAKEHMLHKKQIQHIETERDILVSVESPFVVKLFWTFQTNRNLFLVMEYLPGGDFMSLLECIVQLEEQVARVYIAEVALALNHLHLKGNVHRDLKPDNILISSSGHIKLTDFGLSEEGMSMSDSDSEQPGGDSTFADEPDPSSAVPQEPMVVDRSEGSPDGSPFDEDFTDVLNTSRSKPRTKKKRAYSHTNGRCGTPDYLSPEIILAEPHGPPVDYWALGVILYEMLVGFPPFNDETVDAIFNNILERQILWPDGDKCLSPEAIDLINQLLEPDQSKRLGWDGLCSHPFFHGIDWDTLLDSTPPFVPTLEGPNDTSYFNNRNLTDIFIDDEEFDFDAQSVDSNMMEDLASEDAGSTAIDDEKLMNSLGAMASDGGDPGSVSTMDARSMASSTKTELDPSFAMAHDGSMASQVPQPGEKNLKFPSGMYSGPREDSEITEAFRSFSFTNMNALAAASRNAAELIADTRLGEVENSSALSILI